MMHSTKTLCLAMTEYTAPNGVKYSTTSIHARISRAAREAADRIIAKNEETRRTENL